MTTAGNGAFIDISDGNNKGNGNNPTGTTGGWRISVKDYQSKTIDGKTVYLYGKIEYMVPSNKYEQSSDGAVKIEISPQDADAALFRIYYPQCE